MNRLVIHSDYFCSEQKPRGKIIGERCEVRTQSNHREQNLRYHNRTKQLGTDISVGKEKGFASSLDTETGLAPVSPLGVVSGGEEYPSAGSFFPFLAM